MRGILRAREGSPGPTGTRTSAVSALPGLIDPQAGNPPDNHGKVDYAVGVEELFSQIDDVLILGH